MKGVLMRMGGRECLLLAQSYDGRKVVPADDAADHVDADVVRKPKFAGKTWAIFRQL